MVCIVLVLMIELTPKSSEPEAVASFVPLRILELPGPRLGRSSATLPTASWLEALPGRTACRLAGQTKQVRVACLSRSWGVVIAAVCTRGSNPKPCVGLLNIFVESLGRTTSQTSWICDAGHEGL